MKSPVPMQSPAPAPMPMPISVIPINTEIKSFGAKPLNAKKDPEPNEIEDDEAIE